MCFVCVSARQKSGDNPGHITYDNAAFSGGNPALISGTAAANFNVSDYITTIAEGLNWSGSIGSAATVTYSFDTSGIDTSVVYAQGGYSGFTTAQQQATVEVFNVISSFANITFQQAATSSAANLHFYNGDLGGNTAGIAGFYFTGNNQMTYAAVGMDLSQSDFATKGTYAYTTLLHEIGHAIGLKHSGNYSGSETGPFLPANLDTTDITVMSYNSGNEGNPQAFRPLDIAAIQYLYGAREGSTTNPTPVTVSGSNDNLILTNATDIKAGLGADTVTGSVENDTIYGGRGIVDQEDLGDSLYGNGGNDLMYGNSGGDLIYGDDSAGNVSGRDTIFGGIGEDTIYGGLGDDSLAGGGGIAHPQDDSDTIYGGLGNDSIVANGGNDVVYGGGGNDTFWGGFGSDYLSGEAGNDILAGQLDDDFIEGGAGNDIFYYLGNDAVDFILDFNPGEDRFQLHSNLNGSGIFTGADALARVSSVDGMLMLDLGGGSAVFFGTSGMTLTADHFILL